MFKRAIIKVWNSPTYMTWFSFSAKSLSILVVLPLILFNFTKSEISLWYLFNILFSFQIIADLGFGSTFSRLFSYSLAGLDNLDDIGVKKTTKDKPNWSLIIALKNKMNWVFLLISIIFISIITFISLFYLDEPITRLENSKFGYLLLGLILIILFFKVYSRKYISFLTGVNEVALLRRWEGLITYLQIMSSIIILLITPNFYYLVINNQLWVIIGIINTYFLQKRVLNKNRDVIASDFKVIIIENNNFRKHVLNPAWKSGVGVLSSYGLNQFSAFLLIDYLLEDDLVIYLISFRFISIISEFSRAPFYAKIPIFTQYYQSSTKEKLLYIVRKNMNRATLIAVILCTLLLVFGDFALQLIGSKIKHLDYFLWFLLSVNIIFERLGAMHFQFHSLSNKIVWHKANLIYGAIFISVFLLSVNIYGLYSVPIAMLVGNVFYYTILGIKSTYKDFSYKLLSFHSKIILYLILLTLINLIFLF